MGSSGRRVLAGALALGLAATLGLLGGCDLEQGTAARAGGDVSAAPSDPSDPSDPDDPATFEPTEEDEQAIVDLMEARATAVRDHDVAAFAATVDPRQPKLVAAQTVLYRNLQRLPVSSIGYDVATTYLVPADVPGGDPVLHPQVLEQLQLDQTMTHPVSNKLDVTFVRRGERWLVGAERAPGAKGSVEDPQERPWFGVPIAVRHEGRLTVLVDRASQDQLDGLVATVRDGVERDAGILGVPPDEQVLVDATSNGKAADFGAGVTEQVGAVTFSLVSTDLEEKSAELAGVGIKINPDRIGELVDQDSLLWHELTHYLLSQQDVASPVWLVEGVAAWVEYRPTEMSGLMVADDVYTKLERKEHVLPDEGVFYGDPVSNYLIGQAAVEWLVDRGGTAELLQLMKAYRQLYAGTDLDAVTAKAVRKVYGISLRDLTDGTWATLASLHH